MKKFVYAAIIAILASVPVFGNDFSMSFGGGGLVGGFFTRYSLDAVGLEGIRMKADQNADQCNYGFYAFFDATYFEVSVTYQRGVYSYSQTANVSALANFVTMSGDGWDTVAGFTILGKYPFRLNEKFSLFPLLGLEYQISLRQQRTQADGYIYDRDDGLRERDKDGNAFLLSDWNVFWVHIGCGMDVTLSEKVFLRFNLLYSIRTMTGYERKNLDMVKAQIGDPNPSMGGLTSGPSLRVSLGYKFYTK